VSTSLNTMLTRLITIFTRLNIMLTRLITMLTRLNTMSTRLNTILMTEHPPSRKPVPLLHCIAKSESQLSYDALFRSLCLVADRLGYPNVHIFAVGMDHCEALRNAAHAGGTVGAEVRVVDCIVHVERNLIIHQNFLVARCAADEEVDDEA
jgi:hypothetical protein